MSNPLSVPPHHAAAILLYPGCVLLEVAPVAELLAERMKVRWYTPDGQAHRASNGLLVVPEGRYEDMDRHVKVALLPGGDPGSIVPSAAATAQLQGVHSAGGIVGGICGGALVLAAARLLQGRRATHTYTARHASAEAVALTRPLWDGVEYVDEDVVTDTRVVTAKPWARVDVALEVAQQCGAIRAAERDALRRRFGDRPALG